MGENKILRVKTNVMNRNCNENFKYPILLRGRHPAVQRFIRVKRTENQYA